MLKVLELFSGIGSQTQALKNLGIEHISTQCDIDKYAVESYNQLHGETENLGDISKVNPENLYEGQWDLITYSFPCTDISVAGKQEGLTQGSGTRSSLLWECEKIIRKVKPKYLLMENVKNLVGKKFIAYFESWLKVLEDMGYTNYWKVLNAKDYGVPQNRERVFCVSILGEHKPYVFPDKIPLTVRLKDVLDTKVDEKYYLKNDIVEKFKYRPKEQNGIVSQVIEDFYHSRNARIYTQYAPTLRINCGGLKTAEPILDHIGDVPLGTESLNRVYNAEGLAPTLDTMQGGHRQPKIICYNIPQTVSVRKYPVDCEKLVCILREARDKCGLSTDMIATKLNVPQTMVAHWFRTDSCFSIPEKDIWFKLKDLLKIDTDEFDESITTFEEKDGVFEKANRCYGTQGIAPTLTATSSDEKIVEYHMDEPLICASRGRNPDNPSDRSVGAPTEQRIEVNTKGVSNTLTTVQKDNYVLEPSFRIRKLTPTECWRLMGWTDEQIHKVKGVSNAQLYKQAGNSIVVSVLEAIFRKLFLDD